MKSLFAAAFILAFSVTPVWAEGAPQCAQKQLVGVVDGMVCDFCTQSITKVLMKNDAVDNVAIDLNTKKVTVTLKDKKDMKDEEFNKAVDYAGYKLVKVDHNCKS